MKLAATLVLHGLASMPGPVISVAASPAAPGSKLSISVVGGPANRGDWIALVGVGGGILSWVYLSGTQTPPPAGLAAATVQMTAPAAPGSYEIRLLINDGFSIAARCPLIVGTKEPPPPPPSPEPVLTVSPAVPSIPDTTPRGTIVATWLVRMSDGSPFAGSVRFSAPNFDAGGIFALSSPSRQADGSVSGNIIVNPNGPGVGPAIRTVTEHITLEAI